MKKLFPDKERSAVFPRKHLRKHDSSVIEGRVTAFKEWLRLVVHNETLLKVPEVRGTLQVSSHDENPIYAPSLLRSALPC